MRALFHKNYIPWPEAIILLIGGGFVGLVIQIALMVDERFDRRFSEIDDQIRSKWVQACILETMRQEHALSPKPILTADYKAIINGCTGSGFQLYPRE